VRVVVYAEGVGERAGELTLPPPPGYRLSEEHLGSVHVLVRRAMSVGGPLPEAAICFDSGLRTRAGREPRGSDLHHTETLRRLLSWPRPELRPDLAVIVIDEDEDHGRESQLEHTTADIPVPHVIVAAVHEFEAWLVADTKSLRTALELDVSTTKDPESMPRGESKVTLADWIARAKKATLPGSDSRLIRRSIAAHCNLDEVAKRCPSFDRLVRKLAAVNARLTNR
jgi:hypothetical protein